MLDHWLPYDALRSKLGKRVTDRDFGTYDFRRLPDQLNEASRSGIVGVMVEEARYLPTADAPSEVHASIETYAARKIGGMWYFSDRRDDIDLVKAEKADKPLDVFCQEVEGRIDDLRSKIANGGSYEHGVH